MKTKYGILENLSYEDVFYDSEEINLNDIFNNINRMQWDLLPWCPLFGELPENNFVSAVQITKCIKIIEEARNMWGVPDILSASEEQLNIYESISCDSWPEIQKVSSICPKEDVLLARNIFLEWEDILSSINNTLRRPYKTDTGEVNYLIELYEIDEGNLFDLFEDFFFWKNLNLKNVKSWHIFSILAIYEARKVLNVSLYTHVPFHYYAKAKRDSIEENENDPQIIKQVQIADSLLGRSKDLFSKDAIERLRPFEEKVIRDSAISKERAKKTNEKIRKKREPLIDALKKEVSDILKTNNTLSGHPWKLAGKILERKKTIDLRTSN